MLLLAPLYLLNVVSAQTYTSCNPLTEACNPVPALSSLLVADFRRINSPELNRYESYLTSNKVTYLEDLGAQFQITQRGDSPTVESDFYIMFGRVEFEAQAAPGQGVISSVVLISEDLDEIDIEWIGSDTNQFQTNYFSKGDTSTYDRGGFHQVETPQNQFHNYTIDWTKDQVVWSVDGTVVRTLINTGNNYYPQSPMQVRFGSWAGGDPGNAEGTIEWAGGEIDYSKGPYNFFIKAISVQDYSTGREYAYTDHSGTWMSIQAIDGNINGNLNDENRINADEVQSRNSSSSNNTETASVWSENNTNNDTNSQGDSSSFNSQNIFSTISLDRNSESLYSPTATAETPVKSAELSFVTSANGAYLTSAPPPPIATVFTPDGVSFVISTIWEFGSNPGSNSNNEISAGRDATMTFEFEEGEDSFNKQNQLHDAHRIKKVDFSLPENVGFTADTIQGKSNNNNNNTYANAAYRIDRPIAASTTGFVIFLCVVFGTVLF